MNTKTMIDRIESRDAVDENNGYLQAYGTRIIEMNKPIDEIFMKAIIQQGYYSSVCLSGNIPKNESGINISLIHSVCSNYFTSGKVTENKLKSKLQKYDLNYSPAQFAETEPLLDVPFFREQDDEKRITLMILPETNRIFLSISDPDAKGIYPPFSSFIDHHFKGIGNSGKKVTEYIACFELMNDLRFPVCLNNYRRIESSIIQHDLMLDIEQSVFLLNEKRHRALVDRLEEFMTNLYGEYLFFSREMHPKKANWIIERKIWCTPLHDLHIETYKSIETNDPQGENKLRLYKISFVPRAITKGRGRDWYYEKMALYIN